MRHRLEADRRGCRHLAFVLYYCFPRCATTDSRTLRRQHHHCFFFSLSFPQRAAAALRAMSLRRFGGSFAALPPIRLPSSPRESGSTLALQRLLQLPSYQTAWVLAANCGAPWRGTSSRCRRLRRLQCAQASARVCATSASSLSISVTARSSVRSRSSSAG